MTQPCSAQKCCRVRIRSWKLDGGFGVTVRSLGPERYVAAQPTGLPRPRSTRHRPIPPAPPRSGSARGWCRPSRGARRCRRACTGPGPSVPACAPGACARASAWARRRWVSSQMRLARQTMTITSDDEEELGEEAAGPSSALRARSAATGPAPRAPPAPRPRPPPRPARRAAGAGPGMPRRGSSTPQPRLLAEALAHEGARLGEPVDDAVAQRRARRSRSGRRTARPRPPSAGRRAGPAPRR